MDSYYNYKKKKKKKEEEYLKYAGGGEPTMPIVKSQSLSEGWKNIKSELGKAFDYFTGKKRKK